MQCRKSIIVFAPDCNRSRSRALQLNIREVGVISVSLPRHAALARKIPCVDRAFCWALGCTLALTLQQHPSHRWTASSCHTPLLRDPRIKPLRLQLFAFPFFHPFHMCALSVLRLNWLATPACVLSSARSMPGWITCVAVEYSPCT